ncbi:hypothetical protein [Companilactobacillus ginsenosidimutans]|uniref:Surface layer protein A domain-containing protein n=1 Tax=Companilactobacillus ginsenosidimutans TaxID=1007676 RepID=A0A0H4QJ15_9LACO|nr:hypothetical protein [Companilactobacillus ginsenosidimutans]AKP67912.1 hypothetical protein ABM34_10475 [Companilactobacillus ginsenosidimutans]
MIERKNMKSIFFSIAALLAVAASSLSPVGALADSISGSSTTGNLSPVDSQTDQGVTILTPATYQPVFDGPQTTAAYHTIIIRAYPYAPVYAYNSSGNLVPTKRGLASGTKWKAKLGYSGNWWQVSTNEWVRYTDCEDLDSK